MKKRKRNLPRLKTDEEWERQRAQFERTQRMLAERIAYHEARIAERERAERDAQSG